MDITVDEYGLVRQGQYLVVYIPATETALVFRAVARWNDGFERFDYGPIPITPTSQTGSYTSGAGSVPSTGIIGAYTYTINGLEFPYQSTSAYVLQNQPDDPNDLWFLKRDYNDRLYQILAYFTPSWLRTSIQIPLGTNQTQFDKNAVQTGITSSLGYKRGFMETVQLPYLHYGWLFGNDTNLPVYTMARFIYGEYKVEIPTQAETIFNVITGATPAHWVTLPITSFTGLLERAFNEVYGHEFKGFKVYPAGQRQTALADYAAVLAGLRR